MALTAGSRLGPYKITALIGEGGMGKVWRAHHTALKRDDAVKVLPDAFASDPERLARFRREAQVLASLNHPNIAHVYGLEQADGVQALVMELVEGPTLADRIAQGPIPVDEALPIAKQIAEALEAAHEQGIVHRDLKPANVKVRPDGVVKVLDFGLAKALEPTSAGGMEATAAPTITSPAMMTGVGVLLGTAGYMSPEQARGHVVDRAADIWAFGCVLYEMLAGTRAFTGETITDILGGIVRVDPDWTVLPEATPPAIRSLLRRCLQKDRKKRWKDIADASIEIEEVLSEVLRPAVTKVATPAPTGVALKNRERLAWLVAGVFLLVGVVSLPLSVIHFREPVRDERPIRFVMLSPEKAGVSGTPPIISPDGSRLAFVATLEGRTQLWVRPIDSTTAQPLPGTDGADYPFWSPDSRFIAFFANGRLRKIDASGGPAQTICDALTGLGGAWNREGVIVFAPSLGPLFRVSSAGGVATPLTAFDAPGGEITHRSPSFLPDGRHFLFFVQGGEDKQGVYLGSLETKDKTLLLRGNSSGVYAPPGYLLFVKERALMAQRLDVENLALAGEGFPIAEPVGFYNAVIGTFSVSDNGVLAHMLATETERQLAWFDRAGKLVERVGASVPVFDVALSPDQKRAAIQWTASDIWVVDLVRGGIPSRLTFNPSVEDFPVWSPDGNRILFNSAASGGPDIYWKASSGAGNEELVLRSSTAKRPTDWSRDGRFILYENDDPKSRVDLWVLPLFGDKKPELFLQTPFSERQARFSPDGRWISYISDESGAQEVYVQSFPPSGGKWQVSRNGGFTPRWRRDGRELFYLAPDRRIMSVEVRATGTTFEVSTARALFEAPVEALNPLLATNRYDVSVDGQRFLINAPVENTNPVPITVVVNWPAGVRNESAQR